MLLRKVPLRSHYGLSRGPNLNSFFSLQVPEVPVCVSCAHITVCFLCRVGKFGDATGTGTNWDQGRRPSFSRRPDGSDFWFLLAFFVVLFLTLLKGMIHAH